jgi:hypothetical protein
MPWLKAPHNEVVDYFNKVVAPFLRLPILLSVEPGYPPPAWEYLFQIREVVELDGLEAPYNLPLVGPLSRIGDVLTSLEPWDYTPSPATGQNLYLYGGGAVTGRLNPRRWVVPEAWANIQRSVLMMPLGIPCASSRCRNAAYYQTVGAGGSAPQWCYQHKTQAMVPREYRYCYHYQEPPPS